MKLLVCISNEESLEEALEAVNGRAYDHCFTDTGEIIALTLQAEKHLATLLPKKLWVGAKFVATSGRAVANSYGYRRKATEVCLLRGSKAWYLTGVVSRTLHSEAGKSALYLTPEQDYMAKRRFAAQYKVDKVEVAQCI